MFAGLGLGKCLFIVEKTELTKQFIVSSTEEVPYIKCDILLKVLLSVMVL